MCTTCGCSDGAHPRLTDLRTGEAEPLHATVAAPPQAQATGHHHAHAHLHPHDHPHHHHDDHHHHAHEHHHHHHHGAHAPASHAQDHAHEPHGSASKVLVLEQHLLAKNDKLAERNRGWLAGRGILALNLMSSPGAGKTTLLERTLRALSSELSLSVIEGDQESLNDARRIRATGCDVVQINTGAGCHLEAEMVARALERLDPPLHSVVLIENVGNLVCPALFDLGEHAKVVIMSVTEGADKPTKYPHMFRACELLVLSKIDLLPYVEFDVASCIAAAREVNPGLRVLQLSATRGDGLETFYAWLRERRKAARSSARVT